MASRSTEVPMPPFRSFCLVTMLMACTGAPSAPTSEPEPTPPPTEAKAEPSASAEALMADQDAFKVLAASPLSLKQKVLEAGLEDELAAVVPSTFPPLPPVEDKDAVAFRTGVVFTTVLLTGTRSEKDAFLKGIRALREGLAALGSGAGWLSQIDDAIQHIENDAASREDLLSELDAIVESHVPEEGWGPDDKTGPLVQAGAWLVGIQWTAQAIVRANDASSADKLLKRPEVASFFLKYLKTEEGAQKVSLLRRKIAQGLTELQELTSTEHLTMAEVQRIEVVSGEIVRLVDVAAD